MFTCLLQVIKYELIREMNEHEIDECQVLVVEWEENGFKVFLRKTQTVTAT